MSKNRLVFCRSVGFRLHIYTRRAHNTGDRFVKAEIRKSSVKLVKSNSTSPRVDAIIVFLFDLRPCKRDKRTCSRKPISERRHGIVRPTHDDHDGLARHRTAAVIVRYTLL